MRRPRPTVTRLTCFAGSAEPEAGNLTSSGEHGTKPAACATNRSRRPHPALAQAHRPRAVAVANRGPLPVVAAPGAPHADDVGFHDRPPSPAARSRPRGPAGPRASHRPARRNPQLSRTRDGTSVVNLSLAPTTLTAWWTASGWTPPTGRCYWQVCCFGAQAEHVAPRCTAAPAIASAPSAPKPEAAPNVRTSRRWRSSPTRFARRCAPARAPAPRADQPTTCSSPKRHSGRSRTAVRLGASAHLSIYLYLSLYPAPPGPTPHPGRYRAYHEDAVTRPASATNVVGLVRPSQP
jgi:hypothetical protein